MQNRKKKRRGQKEMTVSQQQIFLRLVVLLFCLAVCWVLFAPGAGVVSLVRKTVALHRAEEEFARLQSQNEVLRTEIRKLHEDPAFLEEVAREQGFLGKGEMVFDFAEPEKKN